MNRIYITFLIVFYACSSFATDNYGQFQKVKIDGIKESLLITPWNSKNGVKLLETAKYNKDFYNLASHFQPQINPLYCGIASSSIILNALHQGKVAIANGSNKVTRPSEFGGGVVNFQTYNQLDLLNKDTDKIKDRKIINLKQMDPELKRYDPGLTLAQLAQILRIYEANVDVHYAQNDLVDGVKRFKKILKKTLNKKDRYILANFHGKTVGTLTSGHISPIAAYNARSEKILVLDVASHKQPWYWVDIEPFYKAMQKKDGVNPRGFLVVSN